MDLGLKGSYNVVPIAMVIMVIVIWTENKGKKNSEKTGYMKKTIVAGVLVGLTVLVNSGVIKNVDDIITGPPGF